MATRSAKTSCPPLYTDLSQPHRQNVGSSVQFLCFIELFSSYGQLQHTPSPQWQKICDHCSGWSPNTHSYRAKLHGGCRGLAGECSSLAEASPAVPLPPLPSTALSRTAFQRELCPSHYHTLSIDTRPRQGLSQLWELHTEPTCPTKWGSILAASCPLCLLWDLRVRGAAHLDRLNAAASKQPSHSVWNLQGEWSCVACWIEGGYISATSVSLSTTTQATHRVGQVD